MPADQTACYRVLFPKRRTPLDNHILKSELLKGSGTNQSTHLPVTWLVAQPEPSILV